PLCSARESVICQTRLVPAAPSLGPPTTETYTLSLHDALPICSCRAGQDQEAAKALQYGAQRSASVQAQDAAGKRRKKTGPDCPGRAAGRHGRRRRSDGRGEEAPG